MATSLLLSCGLNEQNLDPYIHISQDSDVDGSFLISAIIGQRLRVADSGIVLICLQHCFQHYLNCGMRLGYNLNTFKDKGLSVIEPTADIGTNFLDSMWISQDICELLWKVIQDEKAKVLMNKSTVTIIIDDLSLLLNLGGSEKDVFKLSKRLQYEAKNNSNVNVITKLDNSDIFSVINNNLATLSDLNINVIKLRSGNFKEVDGRLLVHKVSLEGAFQIKESQKQVLYKVNERNIKIFNPGEVGVKI